MKRIIAILTAATVLGVLCGCQPQMESVKLRVVTENIFEHQVREAAEYFMEQHSESEVEIQVLSAGKKERRAEIQKLREQMTSGKGADLFLLNGRDPDYAKENRMEELFDNLGKMMKSGVFANLNAYMDKDDYWKSSSYKKEFLTAGHYEGRQYILPLSCNYFVFTNEARGVKMPEGTLEEWVDIAVQSEDKAFKKTVLTCILSRMSGAWIQPGVDYEKNQILFDKERWSTFLGETVSAYREAQTEEEEEPATFFMSNLKYAIVQNGGQAADINFQTVPNLDGRKMAIVKAYGAIGMASKNKDKAYEFLMLFLNDEMQLNKEFTSVKGMIGNEGVPVQEPTWRIWFEAAGFPEPRLQAAVIESYQDLEGAYFATETEEFLSDQTMELLKYTNSLDEEQERLKIEGIAEQAENQYEVMVEE